MRLAQPAARVAFGAFVCRLLGAALLIIAVGRGILAAEAYVTAITPDEALFAFYAAVLWLVVGITGLISLLIGFFVLRPAR